jgi:hypothetical protein
MKELFLFRNGLSSSRERYAPEWPIGFNALFSPDQIFASDRTLSFGMYSLLLNELFSCVWTTFFWVSFLILWSPFSSKELLSSETTLVSN